MYVQNCDTYLYCIFVFSSTYRNAENFILTIDSEFGVRKKEKDEMNWFKAIIFFPIFGDERDEISVFSEAKIRIPLFLLIL